MLTEDQKRRMREEQDRFPHPRTGLLHCLFIAQEENNYVREEDVNEMAQVLDLDASTIWSVASFYTMIHQESVGTYVIQVCDNLPCLLQGADEILDLFSRRLDVDVGETTPNQTFTLKRVECLGSCGTAPVCQVNDRPYHENLTEEDVDRLIERLRTEAENGSGVEA